MQQQLRYCNIFLNIHPPLIITFYCLSSAIVIWDISQSLKCWLHVFVSLFVLHGPFDNDFFLLLHHGTWPNIGPRLIGYLWSLYNMLCIVHSQTTSKWCLIFGTHFIWITDSVYYCITFLLNLHFTILLQYFELYQSIYCCKFNLNVIIVLPFQTNWIPMNNKQYFFWRKYFGNDIIS